MVTLGEVMWQAGYETVFVGAWSVGDGVASDMPHLHGFDRWLGTLAADEASAFPSSLWSDGAEIRLRSNSGGKKEVFVQDFYVDEIVGYLENHARKRPFLLLVHLPGPKLTRGSVSDEYEGFDWTGEERARAAALTDLDRDVGRIMQTLEERGFSNSTIVFLTSDNGPSTPAANAPDRISSTGGLRGRAGELYEGGLRVPFIVCWPGRIAPNTVDDTPAAIWDLLSTCADLGGATRRPRPQDGISLKNLLHGNEISRPGMMYWEAHDPGFAQAVRQGDWKVVRPSGKMELADVELYQLAEDPAESRDLASENPEIVAQFIKGQ